jgi:hypothetical protein
MGRQTNQILEDMLHMYVTDRPNKWEDYVHLVEFFYNNGYQKSFQMSPFEALYGRRCNAVLSWENPVKRITLGLKMLKQMEQRVIKIKQNLNIAQDRYKIYAYRNKMHK